MLHLQLTGLTRLTKNRDVISLLGGIRLNGSMDRLRAPTSLSDGDGGGQQELSQLLSMSSHCSLEGGGQQQQQGSSSECGLSIKAATRPPPLIVITRHGKTEYNKLGIFTGTRHPLPPFLSFLLITSHHSSYSECYLSISLCHYSSSSSASHSSIHSSVGWEDAPLIDAGREEARKAGRLLLMHGESSIEAAYHTITSHCIIVSP